MNRFYRYCRILMQRRPLGRRRPHAYKAHGIWRRLPSDWLSFLLAAAVIVLLLIILSKLLIMLIYLSGGLIILTVVAVLLWRWWR